MHNISFALVKNPSDLTNPKYFYIRKEKQF